MSDNWDTMDKRAKDATDNAGIFVRLADDKDTVVGAFLGDPVGRELYWDQAKQKYEPYTKKHSDAKEQMTLRVLLNFLVTKRGNDDEIEKLKEPKVMVLELNATTFRSVVKVRKKYGFEKCFFEIQRSGKKGDTNTTYTVMSDDDMDEDDREALKSLKLHDLNKLADNVGGDGEFTSYSDSKGGDNNDKSDEPDPDAPIDKDTVAELVTVLKAMPKDDVQKFLAKFGIKQIKLLANKDLDEAHAFIKELKGETSGGDNEDDDDPFA